MSATMKVWLTTDAAPACWGDKALLSFQNDEVRVHLGENGEPVRRVQQAGRKLDGMGIKKVALCGDDWTLENSWAFAQGFYNAKGGQQLELGDMSEEEQAEFNARRTAVHWVREMINGTPEDVYPASLATEAGKFIQSLAPEAVSYRIYSGEQLKDSATSAFTKWAGAAAVRPPCWSWTSTPAATPTRRWPPAWWARALPLTPAATASRAPTAWR